MENKKVLAITISEQLQKKIKYHLLENNMTLKAYVTGVIEENLERNRELSKQEENTKVADKTDLVVDKKEETKGEEKSVTEEEQENIKTNESLNETQKQGTNKQTLVKKVEENTNIVNEQKQSVPAKDKQNKQDVTEKNNIEHNKEKENSKGNNIKVTPDFLKQLKQERTKKDLKNNKLKEEEEEFE